MEVSTAQGFLSVRMRVDGGCLEMRRRMSETLGLSNHNSRRRSSPMRNRIYRAVDVKQVVVAEVVRRLPDGRVWIGVDVGKRHVFAVIRGSDGSFLKPWRVAQPQALRFFVGQLQELARERELGGVVLESTGTYGDPLRQALAEGGLPVHRVSSQATSRYAEMFDGVPSQHDGKDAAMLAELGAMGKSRPWRAVGQAEWEVRLRVEVPWMEAQQKTLQMWAGRLEAHLARFWPEVLDVLRLTSGTLLRLVAKYGGPAGLAADPHAAAVVAKFGTCRLSPEKQQQILVSARTTVGRHLTPELAEGLRRCAKAALQARREIARSRRILEGLAAEQTTLMRMATVVGPVTACILYDSVGDPHNYPCAAAYRKGLGLNLAERSSGEHQGELHITKRGPSIVRRWLYFAALRWIQRAPLKAWYAARRDPQRRDGKRIVVNVMRKLALAVHVVCVKNKMFEPARLLPGRVRSGRAKAQR